MESIRCQTVGRTLNVWTVNVFQCWPALLVPSVFSSLYMPMHIRHVYICKCMHSSHMPSWDVFGVAFALKVKCYAFSQIFFLQRQHLQCFQVRGDGTSSPGDSGGEAPAPGTQGNATQPCHFLLELTSVSQSSLSACDKPKLTPFGFTDLKPWACLLC